MSFYLVFIHLENAQDREPTAAVHHHLPSQVTLTISGQSMLLTAYQPDGVSTPPAGVPDGHMIWHSGDAHECCRDPHVYEATT